MEYQVDVISESGATTRLWTSADLVEAMREAVEEHTKTTSSPIISVEFTAVDEEELRECPWCDYKAVDEMMAKHVATHLGPISQRMPQGLGSIENQLRDAGRVPRDI